jgi:hypothetical protein
VTHRTTFAVALLLCPAVLAVVPSAFAATDIVSIDQKSSENGLKGCHHSGFPIQICDSGSYRLDSNLIVSAYDTDAVQISADNVTLDLNGFTVSGPWVQGSTHFFGTGVYSPNSNITIRNGKLTGFPQGIFVKGSNEFLELVTVTGNNYGIDSWGDSTFVDRATATHNPFGGIVLYGSGMVTNSLVSSNGSGVYIGGAGGYGANTLISNSTDVAGGTSMGTNACTSGKC